MVSGDALCWPSKRKQNWKSGQVNVQLLRMEVEQEGVTAVGLGLRPMKRKEKLRKSPQAV